MKSITRLLLSLTVLAFALSLGSMASANDKVTICHKGNTISISENAVERHLANHDEDFVGECPPPPVCPCWTKQDVRDAIVASKDFDDIGILCETYVGNGLHSLQSLSFPSDKGEFVVLAFGTNNEDVSRSCGVEDSTDLGLERLVVEPISADEARVCRKILRKSCARLIK